MSANFQNIADYYDAMYVEPKEYEEETEKVIQLIEQYSQSDNTRILDIACGTGEQSLYLAKHYQVTGIDLSKEMLEKAREFRLSFLFRFILSLFDHPLLPPFITQLPIMFYDRLTARIYASAGLFS